MSNKFNPIKIKAFNWEKFFFGDLTSEETEVSPDEWLSTPNLKNVIETNGKGDFRNPKTKESIKGWRLKGKGSLVYSPRMGRFKHMENYISLQKFVALIYLPNLGGAISTKTKDGNAFNLHKDNVLWNVSKSGSKY